MPKIIDISKAIIDTKIHNFSFVKKASNSKVHITCFDLAEIRSEIVCADNKGCVTIFDIDKGNVKGRHQVSDEAIVDLSVSSGNNFVAIALKHGINKLLAVNQ